MRIFRSDGRFPPLFDRRNSAAWAVLILGLLFTWGSWLGFTSQVTKNARQQFEFHVADVTNAIEARLDQQAQILLGGVGLFESSASVDRAQWRTYVERQSLSRNFPGLLGMGYSPLILPAALPAHTASVQAEGFPDYQVWPTGRRDLYTAIMFLEPFSNQNATAFGYDMFSEPSRARAMRRAGESGDVAMTGKVRLIQKNKEAGQVGFLMYMPVYRKHQTLATPAQRWAALQGFVYSPFLMNDLMRGILGEQKQEIRFRIYDGVGARLETLLYDSKEDAPRVKDVALAEAAFTTTRFLELKGHWWTLELQSRPQFEAVFNTLWARGLLIAGFLGSVLLFVLVWLLSYRRVQAVVLAEKMTLEVRLNEATLISNAARLQSILDTVADGIISIDAQGRIESFNPAAERIFGYTAQAVIGANIKMLMPEPDHSLHDTYLANYQATSAPRLIKVERELTGQRQDGSTFPMELAVSEMRVQGGRYFTGVVRNITRRHQADQALIDARNAANQANQAKSEFLANMSHELRTPLNAILGFGQLLTYDAQLSEDHRDSVQEILKAGHHLLELINDVLDLAKVESGHIDLVLERVKVAPLVDECLSLVAPLATQGQITLSHTVLSASVMWADRLRLKQALLNLISNAIKYNRVGGSVTIDVQLQGLQGLRLRVTDTGLGIAAEHHAQLFQPFNRLEAEHSEIQGTGIGLTITRQVVERMSGKVDFSSESGVGSIFWIDLPRCDVRT